MKLVSLAVGLFALAFSPFLVVAEEVEQRAVLVTGASSGIGLRITELLSQQGYVVYAGARNEQDLKRLEAMKNVESLRLDVTVQSEIDAAVDLVTRKGRGLYGLVNNAGVVAMGPLIKAPVSDLEWQFDVNVYGPYRVTQAFAPLIIESKGRIVNIGSITGIFSNSMGGVYSMSKHAIEAFTDSLALEMARFDVGVSVIEPGPYASNSRDSTAKRLEQADYWKNSAAYKEDYERVKLSVHNSNDAKDPEDVARAVLHALSSGDPKRRYLVTPDALTANVAVSQAMQRVLQLNQDQKYSLSREQLIKMMDSQLKRLDRTGDNRQGE